MNNLIYVAGPITDGRTCTRKQQWDNVNRGLDAYHILIEKGYAPILPHFSWFYNNHHTNSMSHADWLELDFHYIKHADYFFFLGPSKGSLSELKYAEKLNKIIFNHDDVNDVPLYPFTATTIRMGEA